MRLTRFHKVGLILGFLSAASVAQEFTADGDLPDENPSWPAHLSIHIRRVRRDEQYVLQFSPESIATSSGNALYALPVHNHDLRNLLQNVIASGHSQNFNQFGTSFNSSVNGLEMIMDAIAGAPGNPTFNGQAYANVAQSLLDSTAPASIDVVNSFVGVVKDPAGKIIAQLAIIPQVVVVPDAATPATSPPPPPSPVSSTGGKLRLAKRVYTKSVPRTALKLTVTKTAVVVGGRILANLAKWAVDTVLLEPQAYWTSLMTSSQNYQQFFGNNEFNFVAVRRQGLDSNDMLEVVRAIYDIVEAYVRSGTSRGPRPSAKALQGTILNSAGVIIANWSIGPHPQGQGLGCRIASILDTAFGCIGSGSRHDGEL